MTMVNSGLKGLTLGRNSRLVVDEDDNGKFRPESVNVGSTT